MFQKIAKAGSRKCTSWHAELLGRNVAPLHLAREREMKSFTFIFRLHDGMALHLARERKMKTSKRRVAKISVVVEPKGSAFFRVSKNFFADFQPHFLSVR